MTAPASLPPSNGRPPPGRDAVDEDGDRISVTDVNGTVARFEMTYEAQAQPPARGKRTKFGPPLRARIPSAIYLAAAIAFSVVTAIAYHEPPSSKLFVWAVEGDRIRPLSLSVIAVVVVVSAVATVIRTHMRGVVVSDEWVEARYLLALGIPRAKRWAWAQVTRVVIDQTHTALELYDGSFERLPDVADEKSLARLVAYHAARLRIDVTSLDRAGS